MTIKKTKSRRQTDMISRGSPRTPSTLPHPTLHPTPYHYNSLLTYLFLPFLSLRNYHNTASFPFFFIPFSSPTLGTIHRTHVMFSDLHVSGSHYSQGLWFPSFAHCYIYRVIVLFVESLGHIGSCGRCIHVFLNLLIHLFILLSGMFTCYCNYYLVLSIDDYF